MLDLAAPGWLLLLPLPPLWLWWVWQRQQRRPAPAPAFIHSQTALLLRLSAQQPAAPWRAQWLWLPGVMLLVVAMAQPRWLMPNAPENRTGRDILLALDISGSMRAEDFTLDDRAVSRLDVLKQSVNALLAHATHDRYGIIVFGDDVYTLAPLTHDKTLLTQLVKEIAPGIAGEKTALGDALLAGVARLRAGSGEKTLVLFTDGSRTAGTTSPHDALRIAQNEQVRIFAVGIGSSGEVTVPRGARQAPAVTELPLDEPLLRQLAAETNGQYINVRDSNGIADLARALSDLPETTQIDATPTPFIDWTWLPLSLGIVLVLAQRVWQQRMVAP